MVTENRFDRNERLFGKEGQARLRETHIAVMGAGGLGSQVIAQCALLGVGGITTVDREDVALSDRNRYVGIWHTDSIPGSPKVVLAKRHIELIDPGIVATPAKDDILSAAGLRAIEKADYVFGCVDNDGVRFFINEACVAYEKPLIDLASDVPEPGVFGGHVAIVAGNHGCLHCLDLLDPDEVRRYFSPAEMVENEAAVYGIEASALAETGPSVVSVNGVVASLGVTAFMALVTGFQTPYTFQIYRGDRGVVSKKVITAREDCYYCSEVRGQGGQADLERHFRKAAA